MKYFLGIDPGADGALTVIDENTKIIYQRLFAVKSDDPSQRLSAIVDAFVQIPIGLADAVAFLEHVHAMPGQGVSSMFAFGRSFGHVEMALRLFKIDTRLVHAATWTRAVHRAKAPTAKERSLLTAAMLWPGHDFRASERAKNPHAGKVDSALLAEYGRRTLLAELAQGF